jgi:hypothetical protein
VAPDPGKVTSLGEQANVETIAGERLDERRAGAVADRSESQIGSSIPATLP